MKKIILKYGVLIPALVLLFAIAAVKPVSASANPAADSPITSIKVLYTTEEVCVESASQVYYAVVKKDTSTTVKVAELLPAARGAGSSNKYYIDISTLSASKPNYIGIADTNVPDASGLVHVVVLKIDSSQKKAVFNVNYAIESSSNYGAKILTSVLVTGTDNIISTYTNNPDASKGEHPISDLDIEWRKGANCPWQKLSSMTRQKWESMKTSGAIVYFRIAAKDDSDTEEGQRYSKEQKTKLSVTKAPTLKIDISKLTVSIKNGMQFKLSGTPLWKTLLPYDKKSTSANAILSLNSQEAYFDPLTQSTTTKVQLLGIDALCAALDIPVPTGPSASPITIDVRVAATNKKPASRITTITIPVQAEAPVVSVSTSNDCYVLDSVVNAEGDLSASVYEYFFCKKADYENDKINYSTIKWLTVNKGSKLKGTLKSTYVTTDGARTAVNLSDRENVLLIRRKGQTASTKTVLTLASKAAAVVLPTISSASPTPTPVATPTPAATPSPSATPAPSPEPSSIPTS